MHSHTIIPIIPIIPTYQVLDELLEVFFCSLSLFLPTNDNHRLCVIIRRLLRENNSSMEFLPDLTNIGPLTSDEEAMVLRFAFNLKGVVFFSLG